MENWQVPAATERLAADLHEMEVPLGTGERNRIGRYLAAPWAAYIDKEVMAPADEAVLRARTEEFRRNAANAGQRLEIHTVCQHIYWQKLLPFWREIGLTDLHLSHLEPDVHLADIRVHSWHLAAANVINQDRREGLVFAKPPRTKRYLASFIGAHMPHYRADTRLRLAEEVTRDGFHDVLYELKGAWHYDPVVYRQQVAGETLGAAELAAEHTATVHYNEALSDSVFALCPEGAGPNTIRLWEALAIGAVPVVVVEKWVWPTIPGGDLSWRDAVVAVRRDEISGLFDRLRWMRRFEADRVLLLQTNAMETYRRFQTKRCF